MEEKQIWGSMQMAEPTCLMRSFSQPSERSRDFSEGDPARCLGESISFGRYMSEPLGWEKWSTFSNNRYLEEAEKSSKPGSVAKMKAYFEAYYKGIASRKREKKDEEARRASDLEVRAVVEQSSCSNSDAPQEDDSASDKPSNEEDCNLEFSSGFAPVENEECRALEDPGYMLNSLDSSVQLEVHCSEDLGSSAQLEAHPSDDLESSLQLESKPSNELEQLKCTSEVESSKIPQEGDGLEKRNSNVKSGDSEIGRSAISKPSISLEPVNKDDDQKRLSLKIKKLPDSNSRILLYCKPSKLPKSSGKVVASQATKVWCVTPRNSQQAKDTLKAIPSTSVHKSIKFGPHADVIKKSSRTVQKSLIKNPCTPSARIMKVKTTPLQTPNRASVVGKPKHTSATPRPEIGRSISTPGRSLSRGMGIARGPELQPPSLNNIKPISSCGLKARASITFSPFNFRTEERAAKRREFFLKQQEREAEKTQQSGKAKERVNTARQLLHTRGLKAKSAVDSNVRYSRQEICTHPQPMPLKQSDALKPKDRKNDLPCYQSTSLSKKVRHENASPNIL